MRGRKIPPLALANQLSGNWILNRCIPSAPSDAAHCAVRMTRECNLWPNCGRNLLGKLLDTPAPSVSDDVKHEAGHVLTNHKVFYCRAVGLRLHP